MPVLDLIGNPLPDTLVVEGRMAFVGNDALYNSYFACNLARQTTLLNGPDEKVEIPKTLLHVILFSPSILSINDEYKKLIKQGLTSGIVLDTIYNMHMRKLNCPSVNKGVYVAEVIANEMNKDIQEKTNSNKVIISSSRIKKYWAAFKSVSPLWAAKYQLLSDEKTMSPADHLRNLLALAEIFQKFGEQFTPVGTKTPIFTPGECWAPPEGYGLPPVNLLLQNKKDKRLEIILESFTESKAWANN